MGEIVGEIYVVEVMVLSARPGPGSIMAGCCMMSKGSLAIRDRNMPAGLMLREYSKFQTEARHWQRTLSRNKRFDTPHVILL